MSPRWFEKAESKARRLLQAPPRESVSTSSPSPTPSQPVSQSGTGPTSAPTSPLPVLTDPDISSLPILQERLWNQAYDDLGASEPKLVEAYEKILTAELCRDHSSFVASAPTENNIGNSRETRCLQMQQLVQEGLDRSQKAASLKRGIDQGLQAVQAVRGIVDKAVQTAPAAAVAWVGVCFGLEILSNPITEACDNRKGIAYVLSRMEWYWNLASLLLDENKAERSPAVLRVQLQKHIVQLFGQLLSYQIQSVCLYRRNWAAVIGRDMVKIDDWAGQLGEIQEAEAVVQRDVEQYNTEESKVQLRKLTDAAVAVEMNLRDIHSAIQDQTQKQEKRHQDERDSQCLKDLRETDPRDDKTRIQDTKGGLLRDSYRWILENDDFQRWRDDSQGQLLWIKGDPGKGKTMLLCGIIDELEKEPGACVSYFFCQATEARLSNATAVLRGLIYLLVEQQPSLISHVSNRHDHAGKQLFEDGNAWEALSKILAAMLDDPSSDGVTLVVDALDECKTNRHQLLDFITKPSRVKWIVSSRNWQDIEEKLDNAKQKVRLHLELNNDSISKAVETYIGYKVNQLESEKKYDQETRHAVESHLTSNADNTFLWVALVCQELADPKVRKRHTLSRLKSFPSGLDSLYGRMMEGISESEDADICKEVLAVASVVYRPLTLDELNVLVQSLSDMDQEDLKEIIGSCGSFLTLREGVVYFVHQSAKDYLLKKASDHIMPSGTAHQHCTIFLRSLESLSVTLRRDIYSLLEPGFSIHQVSPPNPDPLAAVRYSCVYWVDHLDNSEHEATKMRNNALQDSGVIDQFLKSRYLYWLESLSLLRSMSEGVLAMRKLEGLVKPTGARQLSRLVRDAHRFILSHKPAIEPAPLQAYASALVFSPTNSLIKELFKKEEPDWVTLSPSMQLDWNACLQTFEGHDGDVESVAISPDGLQLASGSSDNTVKIWDAATGECLQTLKGHDGMVFSVAFSADGQQLASGSFDKTIKLWDPAMSICIQTFEGHTDAVNSVAWSGQQLASGSNDNTVKIWDILTGICVKTLEEHEWSVSSVAFSANGQKLASGSDDDTIKLWDPVTGACIQTLKGHSEWVRSVAFSADSQQLASGSDDFTIKLWDPLTGACIQTLEGHSNWVTSVAFSADSRQLVSGSQDTMVKIWDIGTGACVQTLEGHGATVTSVAFSTDNQQLVTGSEDETIKIWDIANDTYAQMPMGHGDGAASVVFSADNQRLASGLSNAVKTWDVTTGACVQTFEGHNDQVTSVAFSSGHQLASGSADKTVKLWHVETGVCLQTLIGHSDLVLYIAFSSDGQRLASCSYDTTVKVWDVLKGTCVQTLQGHDEGVGSVAFSATDGQQLASGSYDGTVKVWNVLKGICMQTLQTRGYGVSSVAFVAVDGQRLASGSYDGTVRIWDILTGTCVQTLETRCRMTSMSFDPMAGSLLSTNIGLLKLDLSGLPPAIDNESTETVVSQAIGHSGYGIGASGIWIVKDEKRILWLPSEYRSSSSVIGGSTVALGYRSGSMLVLKLSWNP